jgi:sterol desaturase/sphingolipid hydroxylase (fatty acid hydroxylase superfamily)
MDFSVGGIKPVFQISQHRMDLAASIHTWQSRLALGGLVVLLGWEIFQPFFRFFANDRLGWRNRGRHALVNLAIGLINTLITPLVFVGLWFGVTAWAADSQFGLLNWLGTPAWLRWPLTVLLLDAWTYHWHRLNHRVPFFWRFHALHHSDRAMDVTTASRFHLGEIVLSSLLRIPVLPLIGCRIEELALYELLLFAVVQFHHANIGLPESLDKALRAVIVTPHLHKVHHSVLRAECNSNYSSLFSWWDRLFGTIRFSPNLQAIAFGVDELQFRR